MHAVRQPAICFTLPPPPMRAKHTTTFGQSFELAKYRFLNQLSELIDDE